MVNIIETMETDESLSPYKAILVDERDLGYDQPPIKLNYYETTEEVKLRTTNH